MENKKNSVAELFTDENLTSLNDFIIDLHSPPYTKIKKHLNYNQCTAIIQLHNLVNIRGILKQFNTSDELISILEPHSTTLKTISMNDIQFMRLEEPYESDTSNKNENSLLGTLTPESNLRSFRVEFRDGSDLHGSTLGSRLDRNGVHFYQVIGKNKNPDSFFHLFIPNFAIRDYVIGEKIGELLVNQKDISKTALNGALKDLEKNRKSKIGDYLVSNKIVDSDALTEALERQKHIPYLKLGEILISEDLISESQLEFALKEQKRNKKTPLGEILINKGVLKKDQLQRSLAKKLGIPFVNLKEFVIEPDILQQFNTSLAFQYSVIPLYNFEGNLALAIENPLDWQTIDSIRFASGQFIEPVMASAEDITWALQFYFSTDDINDVSSNIQDTLLEDYDDDDESYDKETFSTIERSQITENVVVRVVNKIIYDAYTKKVSDIHIEPGTGKQKVIVRFRKDGILSVYYKFPSKYKSVFVSRLKVMANLDISLKFKPQDGKIKYKNFSDLDIELRVATIPTSGDCEDVVIRLLTGGKILPISGIGLSSSHLDSLLNICTKPHGLLLVCGPTGSGKTTTLHSILSNLNTFDKKVWTVEDPVEITQPGLRQIAVNDKVGLTFSTAMRSLLRADPDVIMVGEMRDAETAAIGIEASLTGHLVLSTLHTNSAAETVTRLLDMDMDEFNFADALLGILSQKLVRTLCVSCKTAYHPDASDLHILATEYIRESSDSMDVSAKAIKTTIEGWRKFYFQGKEIKLYKPTGCKECLDTGYRGRIGVHELLVASPQIKKLILNKASSNQIKIEALQSGMQTRKQDGIDKILMGFTDYPQVRII